MLSNSPSSNIERECYEQLAPDYLEAFAFTFTAQVVVAGVLGCGGGGVIIVIVMVIVIVVIVIVIAIAIAIAGLILVRAHHVHVLLSLALWSGGASSVGQPLLASKSKALRRFGFGASVRRYVATIVSSMFRKKSGK